MNLEHDDYYCILLNVRTRLVPHFLTIQLPPCSSCKAAERVTGSFLRIDRVVIVWLYIYWPQLLYWPQLSFQVFQVFHSSHYKIVVYRIQACNGLLVMPEIQQAVSKKLLNELMIEHSYDRKSIVLSVKFCVIVKLTIQKSLKLLLRIFGTVTDQQER